MSFRLVALFLFPVLSSSFLPPPATSILRRPPRPLTSPPRAYTYWLDPTAENAFEPNFQKPSAFTISRPTTTSNDDSASPVQAPRSNSNIREILDLLQSENAKKWGVWAAFGVGVWGLRSFYGIILGTFVLTYIGSSVVKWSMEKGNRLLERFSFPGLPRRLWALGYIASVLLAIMSLTVLTVPRVAGETNYLSLVFESANPYVSLTEYVKTALGPEAMSKLESFLMTVTGEEGKNFAAGLITATVNGDAGASAKGAVDMLADAIDGVWNDARTSRFAKLLEFSLKGYVKSAFNLCRTLISHSTKVIYKGILSLLFSFMFIWDLPRIGQGMSKLSRSRVGFAYDVLAPKISSFGMLVGQSFEVQSLIALVNTVLTTIGVLMLKIPGYGFLSMLVLVCSFIPVFGVFLSTVPIAVVALSEYGVSKMIKVILMVIFVHIVEAYLLSPVIYSNTLKLHPVLILGALYFTEHLVGIQGLFLAVPVTMYVSMQLFSPKEEQEKEDGKGKLATE